MVWVEVFNVLLVCHLVGDFLLQTEWQALNKHGGLSERDPEKFRALVMHICTYSIPFIPAFIWVGHDHGTGRALESAAIAIVTHFIQDDGKILKAYVHSVKHTTAQAGSPLWMAIDQSCHVVFLFAAALVATAS